LEVETSPRNRAENEKAKTEELRQNTSKGTRFQNDRCVGVTSKCDVTLVFLFNIGSR